MYFVHEIHSLTRSGAADYEALLRDRWAPALARQPGTRLVWCTRAMPGSVVAPEIITLTAVADGATLEQLGERIRDGDLREDAASLAAGRTALARRVLAPLKFTRYEPDLDRLPMTPDEPADALYIHDFVPPRIGMQRPYEDAMETAFLRSLEVEYSDFVMWGGFETVAGGGPVPENVMITLIRNSAVTGPNLLTAGNPRESLKPGAWMFEALKLRDTWTSRLLRTVAWSPTS